MVVMSLGCCFVLPFLNLLLVISVHCNNVPDGVQVECRDRYLWVSIEKPLADRIFQIEALDDTGVYPIMEKYASECGYTHTYDDASGNAILRASYLSCHTDNPTDEVFVFNFNLITSDQGAVSVPLSKTCTLSLPWSNREVICEHKYMEVSVRNVHCASNGETSNSSTSSVAHESATNGFKVLFLKGGEEVASLSIGDARMLGYVIDATAERIVFRAAYGQPHSEIKKINGIPVEVAHATVFFRRSWTVVMIDLTGACTSNLGSFDGEKLLWKTPMVMTPLLYDHSGFVSEHIRFGVKGQLLDDSTIRDWGYMLDISGDSVWIGVPYSANGGHRWSFVEDNTYSEYYWVSLYYEHVFMDGSGHLTRFRQVKKLTSPLLLQVPFTIDQTILEEHYFTVYLGNFPYDVELFDVVLNGEPFSVPEAIQSGYPIARVPHSNGTHAYVLRVPFEDPVVPKMYFSEGILQYSLNINYTLNIIPHDPYYHSASVIAQIKDVFPPDFNGVCTETGIIFKMDHQKLGYLWEIGIGHYPLTTELAAHRGYLLHNDSRRLTLEVPVFTLGYIYEDINLKQFFGTFEILSRDAKTLEIQKSAAKRCLFRTDELIVCSPDGVMTVVANVTAPLPEAEPSRATITYENEILVNRGLFPEGAPVITRDADFRLTVQCYYPVHDFNQLFVDRKFKSETPGFGSINQASDLTVKHMPKQTTPPNVPKQTTPHVPKQKTPPTVATATTKLGPVQYVRVTLG
ncbi:uncharacterized protein LOC133124705 isoform X2 [Conger conger]|uniref:uncharacterized protein LOC133124705 isoform X2 n=1 Tax=Conger conger TaxID=82655 RepID=UPI002A59DACA|nr:uncharacterized protein LOC133124705 isoform X2 [Conger conger]